MFTIKLDDARYLETNVSLTLRWSPALWPYTYGFSGGLQYALLLSSNPIFMSAIVVLERAMTQRE